MLSGINMHNVGIIVAVISGAISGIAIWLYWRKVTSSQKSDLTWWQKYGQLSTILAVTNFITASGFFWTLFYNNQSVQTIDDWLTAIMGYVGCFGCLFGVSLFIYIANVNFSLGLSLPRKDR